MRLFILSMTCFLFTLAAGAGAAHAQYEKEGVYHCGTPVDNELTTNGPDHAYCDMYSRRFEYREKKNELRDLMDARRENFIANESEAKANYAKRLEEMYSSNKAAAKKSDDSGE